MTSIPITIEEIRKASERLANAHNDTVACSALLQAEIKDAIAPIMDRYKGTLDQYAAAEAAAYALLDDLLLAAPQLFVKPRSLTVDGVRCGFKKEPDSLDWDDEDAVIARIKALKPDQVDLFVRKQESINHGALEGLDAADLRAFGIRQVTGVDVRFITVGDNDVEKLAKAIIADAMKRQGEDEKPKAKSGKAKKAAVPA